MSRFEQSFPAAQIARELGIQVLTADVPKLVSALHRAYGTGLRDGADAEREARAKVCDNLTSEWTPEECATSIRARGQEGSV